MTGRLPYRLRLLFAQVGLAVSLVIAMQIVSGGGGLGIWGPAPARIGRQLLAWFATGEVLPHLFSTLQVMAMGYAIGLAVGSGLGIALGLSPRQGRAWDGLIRALNSIPLFALAPLFVLWLGIGLLPQLLVVVVVVGYLILSVTLSAVRDVDRDVVATLQTMGASRRQIVAKVILPSVRPAILFGAQVGVPYGLVAAIAAELIVGSRGLGYLLARAGGQLEIDQLYADILLIMAIGVVINVAIGRGAGRWSDPQSQLP